MIYPAFGTRSRVFWDARGPMSALSPVLRWPCTLFARLKVLPPPSQENNGWWRLGALRRLAPRATRAPSRDVRPYWFPRFEPELYSGRIVTPTSDLRLRFFISAALIVSGVHLTYSSTKWSQIYIYKSFYRKYHLTQVMTHASWARLYFLFFLFFFYAGSIKSTKDHTALVHIKLSEKN